MFRGRNLHRISLITLLIVSSLFAVSLFSGCIFSPKGGGEPPPPVVLSPPGNSTELIARLEDAYQKTDIEIFRKLFAQDPDNKAEYLFLLSAPTPEGETQWGFTEELRIHQRMFDPENLPPGEPELDPNLWLDSINIQLTPTAAFEERPDLYQSDINPGGLDPNKWVARDAKYTTFVFFDTQGENDFLVEGEANFIVIEDKDKKVGDEGKFLIFRWEDLGDASPKPVPEDSPI